MKDGVELEFLVNPNNVWHHVLTNSHSIHTDVLKGGASEGSLSVGFVIVEFSGENKKMSHISDKAMFYN